MNKQLEGFLKQAQAIGATAEEISAVIKEAMGQDVPPQMIQGAMNQLPQGQGQAPGQPMGGQPPMPPQGGQPPMPPQGGDPSQGSAPGGDPGADMDPETLHALLQQHGQGAEGDPGAGGAIDPNAAPGAAGQLPLSDEQIDQLAQAIAHHLQNGGGEGGEMGSDLGGGEEGGLPPGHPAAGGPPEEGGEEEISPEDLEHLKQGSEIDPTDARYISSFIKRAMEHGFNVESSVGIYEEHLNAKVAGARVVAKAAPKLTVNRAVKNVGNAEITPGRAAMAAGAAGAVGGYMLGDKKSSAQEDAYFGAMLKRAAELGINEDDAIAFIESFLGNN